MGTIGQLAIFPVVWFLTKIFSYSVEFENEENFSEILNKPAIIIANHLSFYDSFLLRLSPYWIKLKVYFMGVTRFNSKWLRLLNSIGLIHIIYKIFGVFKVIPGRGLDKNLEVPQKILARGHVVFIFPEGSINTSGRIAPFKRGAAVLSLINNVPILPIGFRRITQNNRSKMIISIGSLVKFPTNTDYQDATRQLEVIVKKLCHEDCVQV